MVRGRGGKTHGTRSRNNTVEEKTTVEDKTVNCGICNEECEDTPEDKTMRSIECECCLTWYHLVCADIDDARYNIFAEYDDMHWFCPNCNKGATKLYTQIATLKNEIRQSEAKIMTEVENTYVKKTDLQADFQAFRTEFDEFKQKHTEDTNTKIQVAEDHIDALKTDTDNKLEAAKKTDEEKRDNADPTAHPVTPARLDTAVNEAFLEREDIIRRKHNVMFHNLPEALPDGTKDDSAQVKNLATALEITDNIVITDQIRFGDTTPKLLKITVQTLAMKRKLLSNAVRLRQLPEGNPFAKVYIRPDLTPKQQEVSKNLGTELKNVRDNDPANKYKIIRGVITKLPGNPR